MARSTHLAIFLLSTLSTVANVNAKPWLASVTPNTGSLRGGTTITLLGDGFSPNKFTFSENKDPNYGNWVYFRVKDWSQTFTCEIEQTGTNVEKIVCITPDFEEKYVHPLVASVRIPTRAPFSNMEVFVVSDGEVSNVKTFTANMHQTPLKTNIDVKFGYPNREIEVVGDLFTRAYNESMPNYEGSPCCQDRCRAIKFKNGNDLCDIYQDQSSDSSGPKTVRKYELYNDGRDSKLGYFKCKLGGNNIGYQNISWTVTRNCHS